MSNYKKLTPLFSIILFFTSSLVQGQKTEDFNALRKDILSEMVATDIDKAFAYTDTLKKIAKNRNQEIKVEMTRAVLYNQQGDLEQALDISMDAEKAFLKNRDYEDQIGVIGFIASNFKENGRM